MQLPILSGIYTDSSPSLRVSYPINLVPVAQESGVSNYYLKPADGIVSEGTGPGNDRGGILWNNVLYRVMGSKLVTVDSSGTVTTLGDVEDDGKQVSMDYSFDRLAIVSNGKLFYWNGTTLTEVTDPDVGTPIDIMWVDGYFFYADDESNLVVTELADPEQIDPLKYGSSEVDPDPVLAVRKIRNEPHAINRYTIEVFDNIGGTGFPFQRIPGAQVQKGAVGTHAVCEFMGGLAFVGSGRHEQPSVYISSGGQVQRIATREIEEILETYTDAQLADILIEKRNDRSSMLLYIHLPDRTLVYSGDGTWFILTSAYQGYSQYRARNMVWAYGKWCVGDPASSNVGSFSDAVGEHWGSVVRWEFGTQIIFNETNGVIMNQMELVTLTGSVALNSTPTISTQFSLDGQVWSPVKEIQAGTIGDRLKRLVWFRQGLTRNLRMQRFQGTSDAHLTFLRLDAQIEPLVA